VAELLIADTEQLCPYSKATRGNIEVAVTLGPDALIRLLTEELPHARPSRRAGRPLQRRGIMAFTIKINGNAQSVDVDGDTPLLWVLRDVLGMTGTKFGCGMALCGACTVHIDGVATRSCVTTIDSIGKSQVTTIEAIGATPAGARIQKAWLDHEVVQCGYCQSGQIMSASALLASKPNPTDADIDDAMSGNICRCGTYVRIREAIKLAAQTNAKGG
jgi:isoquinoline 1-oxidoreductase alpha subunit